MQIVQMLSAVSLFSAEKQSRKPVFAIQGVENEDKPHRLLARGNVEST